MSESIEDLEFSCIECAAEFKFNDLFNEVSDFFNGLEYSCPNCGGKKFNLFKEFKEESK